MNALAPYFGDGHFYNTKNGRRHFLEIKADHILKVSDLKVTHKVKFGPRLLFTWREQRDLLLSIPPRRILSSLLIPWRKMPEDWRTRGYEGEDKATTSIDEIRPYLVPWPEARAESLASFSTRVAGQLDQLEQEESMSFTPGPDSLRELPHEVLKGMLEGDQDKRAGPRYDFDYEPQRSFAHKSALALHRVLLKRYQDHPCVPGSTVDVS